MFASTDIGSIQASINNFYAQILGGQLVRGIVNENRIIQSAFVLSLLLHLVLAGVIWRMPVGVDSSLAQNNEIELVIIPDQDESQPQKFVLLPERAANNQKPDSGGDPIAASLFDSRAADELQGGNDVSPSARELDDYQKVEIRKDNPSGEEGVDVTNQPLPMAPKQSSGATGGDEGTEGEEKSGDNQENSGQWAVPRQDPAPGPRSEENNEDKEEESPELKDWWGGDSPTLLKEGEKGPAGDRGFDFNQKESGSQGAGVAYVGNYSMNTYEWAFSPWIQKWVNQLHRHWKAPYAYSHLWMIHGKTLLRMVINKDGRMDSFEVLDSEGHQSLHEASEAAVKAFTPYAPLPADFPEEHLVLIMELRYPALR